jgi:hypothetical protein
LHIFELDIDGSGVGHWYLDGNEVKTEAISNMDISGAFFWFEVDNGSGSGGPNLWLNNVHYDEQLQL